MICVDFSGVLPFLPSWKWKTTPNERKLLLEIDPFFTGCHEYGKKVVLLAILFDMEILETLKLVRYDGMIPCWKFNVASLPLKTDRAGL